MKRRKIGWSNYDWLVARREYDGADCLIWPFSRFETGYGQVGHEGRVCRAHRLMCEMVNGPPPTPEHEAAHECGNGAQGCVHPKHLTWKTREENTQDKVRHGKSKGYASRLTPEQVAEIIKLKGTEKCEVIAERFSVTRATVRQIQRGDSWALGIHPRAVRIRHLLGISD
jgi:hypothetical protein